MHEHGLAVDVRERALTGVEQPCHCSHRLLVQLLGAEPVAARDQRQRDRPVARDRLLERRHEREVERRDQNRDGAAAGEPDLEGGVVGDAILA